MVLLLIGEIAPSSESPCKEAALALRLDSSYLRKRGVVRIAKFNSHIEDECNNTYAMKGVYYLPVVWDFYMDIRNWAVSRKVDLWAVAMVMVEKFRECLKDVLKWQLGK